MKTDGKNDESDGEGDCEKDCYSWEALFDSLKRRGQYE
jgi:hypothetical protein